MTRPLPTAKKMIAEQLDSMNPSKAELAAAVIEPPYENPFDSDEDDGYYVDPIILAATDAELYAARDVEVINICAVIELIFGLDYWTNLRFLQVSYKVRQAALKAYAEENGCALYAAGREHYSPLAAQLTAVKAGLKKVIAEDLS